MHVWNTYVCLVLMGPLLATLVCLLPVPFEPVEFHLPSRPYMGDSLPDNNKLQQADRILEGLVNGPESLALREGVMYSGTADGKIIKVDRDSEVSTVASLGSTYCVNKTVPECGRPLGLRMNSEGELYVIDAHLGLFRINISTGDILNLVSGEMYVDNKPVKFFNDLDVQSDGMVYFTHSSTKWQRNQHLSLAMEANNDSRLLKYDPTTGRVSVLLDGLVLANGVQLSSDERFLLVAEGGRMRIHRYFLHGPEKGQSEIFVENLPGFVDNIRPSSRGGFWVAHPTKRQNCLYDILGPRPGLRRFLLKFFSAEFIFMSTTKPSGLILELSEEGEVLQRLDDPTGAVVSYISEVLDTKTHLYLGSYTSQFLARLNLE